MILGSLGGGPQLSEQLIELSTYIAKRYETAPRFGLLKLAKILFNVDKEWLCRHGATYTGLEWWSWQDGPYTKDLRLLAKAAKHLTFVSWWTRDKRLQSIRWHRRGFLPEEVIEIADMWIERYREMDYQAVSQDSHGIAWRLARYGGRNSPKRRPIPVEMLYLAEPQPHTAESRADMMRLFRQAQADG